MGIGATIKDLLSQKNMSIKELSLKTGIPVNTLYSITKRDNASIRVTNLQKIASVLDVDVDTIIGWNKERSVEDNLESSPAADQIILDTINNAFNDKTIQISFNTENYTTEELGKILEYAEFLKKSREKGH